VNASKLQTNRFAGVEAASISIADYMRRIHHFVGCNDEIFVVGLIYIDRFLFRRPAIVMNTLTVHRLVVTAILVAAKFYNDSVFNNKFFARVGGLATSELNLLETEFLFGIDFKLIVESDASDEGSYSEYVSQLYQASLSVCVPVMIQSTDQAQFPYNQHKKTLHREAQKKRTLIPLCTQSAGLCGSEQPTILHATPSSELCG
jgi:hypothetical protein